MTAFLKEKTEIDGKTPSHQYNKKISINQQYKANRIRPESPQGGFVLYCSEHRFCKAKTDGVYAERGFAPVTPYRKDNQMRERNTIINIRVTDKEKKALERSAKRAGLSLSAFLRKAGLNEKVFVKPSASLFKAYEATERLLKKFPSFSKGDIEVCLIDIEEKLLDAYREKEADSVGDNKNMGN